MLRPLLPALALLATPLAAQDRTDPMFGLPVSPPPAPLSVPFLGGQNALDFTPGSGACGNNALQAIGWQFDVLNPIEVSAMSWFDDGQDGLELEHEVAIWDPAGNLVVGTNVIIPTGTAAALEGIWRTVDIAPVVLQPGVGYIVGGMNGVHNECLSANVTHTPHLDINFVDATFGGAPPLQRPTNFSVAVNGFYGVGFQLGEGNGSGNVFCDPAAPHSGGASVTLASSSFSGPGVLHLEASDGPPGEFGYFLVAAGFTEPGTAIGNGFLCLDLPIGRYGPSQGNPTLNSLGVFDAAGVMQNTAGTSSSGSGFDVPMLLPAPPGGAIAPGDTWSFQCWYRDGVRSNFSNVLEVGF